MISLIFMIYIINCCYDFTFFYLFTTHGSTIDLARQGFTTYIYYASAISKHYN